MSNIRRSMMMKKGENIDYKTLYIDLIQGTATSINVPEGTTIIRSRVFTQTYLYTVTLPSTLTTIQNDAFNSCSQLTSITIPASVTSIGGNAFNWCSELQYVIMEGSTPPTLSNSNAFNNTNNCPIYVPNDAVNTYKSKSQWSNLASRIFSINDKS